MATLKLTKDNLDATIADNDIVILDFWAQWCGPCRAFGPTFEAASEQHPDIVFAKVNTEEERELAGMFQIRSIPTLMIFREQIPIFEQPGALPKAAFDDLIDKVKALDMDDVRKQVAAHNAAQASA